MPRTTHTNTKHHCPLKGKNKGPCRPNGKLGYCTEHQHLCPKHPQTACLKDEVCNRCHAEQQAREREEHRRREEERRVAEARRREEREEQAMREKANRRGGRGGGHGGRHHDGGGGYGGRY